jgi:hypothetical protein
MVVSDRCGSDHCVVHQFNITRQQLLIDILLFFKRTFFRSFRVSIRGFDDLLRETIFSCHVDKMELHLQNTGNYIHDCTGHNPDDHSLHHQDVGYTL